MKDEKEINTSSDSSNEELEASLDKTENYEEEQLNQELQKLAQTFRDELKKAKEQGSVKVSDLEVVDENNNVIPKEELCECCGERRKDKTISENYAYCSECRELMKRYPINIASVIIALAMIAISVCSVIVFGNDFDGYNNARLAKEADADNKRFSAVEYYDAAIAFFDEQDIVAKRLYKESAFDVFRTLPNGVASLKDVSERIEKSVTEFEAKLPIYNSYKELRDNALIMYNTFNAFYTVINNTEYGSFDKDDKETINTIYSDIGQLAEKELTIDSLSGDEKETVTYDKAAVLFSKFMFAYSYNDFDKAYECMTELWQTYPEFVQMFGYEYAVIEIQSGNFKNAIRIADAVKANNAEDAYPYVVYSYTERMQGDYEKAIKKADEGLLIDKTNSDLYRQKGIALMLNGELKEAVEVFETGLGYSEYAVLYYTYLVALNELGDTEKIEEVQGILKDSGLETPERVQKYLDGKISCKQLFTEGTGDIE